jgi:hypothetical protein
MRAAGRRRRLQRPRAPTAPSGVRTAVPSIAGVTGRQPGAVRVEKIEFETSPNYPAPPPTLRANDLITCSARSIDGVQGVR